MFSDDELGRLRLKLDHGLRVTQAELDQLMEDFCVDGSVVPDEGSAEQLPLVDAHGNLLGVRAPRWLSHLLGLRHPVVHVMLRWVSPRMGNVYVLQVRSWDKTDSPGCVDISVGGHVVDDVGPGRLLTAFREMEEELGIGGDELISRDLIYVHGYEFTEERAGDNFYNTEWRDLYVGEITRTGVERIKFDDREVVGLFLCPAHEAKNLLRQRIIPLGSGLRRSLPFLIGG